MRLGVTGCCADTQPTLDQKSNLPLGKWTVDGGRGEELQQLDGLVAHAGRSRRKEDQQDQQRATGKRREEAQCTAELNSKRTNERTNERSDRHQAIRLFLPCKIKTEQTLINMLYTR
ncbi:hypothetical protein PCANC_00594 [Puccinia coronata f. sp. avenae]|uniref:Uncharacterized protein n=1 Tax=Puccinia coronata f. sp. avenae TaxID=200324 RepID=A0A2N5VE98_9BASI|nr:hypothetical protein PCASD_02879 [Puccinia coronata f. sp. avenae]PLW58340.1 hypothetical protein PCANC_00594 [Puccinia coronata f. sp. avenae]